SGPSLQKPFQEYLEAQRIKLHHKSDSAVPQVRSSLPPSLPAHFSFPCLSQTCSSYKQNSPFCFSKICTDPGNR
ncbi:hypothetical protein Nmel_016752, partial [Mimus melanotis]